MAAVGLKCRGGELRIRENEVLRKSVASKHRAADVKGNKRQILVSRISGGVVQRCQRRGQRRVVSVGQVAAQSGFVSEMQRAGLTNAIECCANWAKSRAGNVDPIEHLIQ